MDEGEAGKLVRDILKADKQQMKLANSVKVQNVTSNTVIDSLRNEIQILCQSIGPLGKCAEMCSEDLEQMNVEFKKWQNMNDEYSQQVNNVKAVTNETIEPLVKRLDELNKQVQNRKSKVRLIKGNLDRNDQTIRKLLEQRISLE